MNNFFEVTVEIEVGQLKNGKVKTKKEVYLVDAQSVTEAEARVIRDFEKDGNTLDYKVSGAKKSKIISVIKS